MKNYVGRTDGGRVPRNKDVYDMWMVLGGSVLSFECVYNCLYILAGNMECVYTVQFMQGQLEVKAPHL